MVSPYPINPIHCSFIKFLQSKYEVMRSHVTGIGAEKLINQIEGFERENIMKARKKMMLSNKDLITRLMKPRAKIYTAKGGIESYNLATSEMIEEWKVFLSHCANKKTSLKEYIRQKIQVAYDIDPMGLKWIGINDEGEPYPTYKCIMNILDYEINDSGQPEYVVFKCSDAEIKYYIEQELIPKDILQKKNCKIYRVVDDSRDMICTVTDGIVDIAYEIDNVFAEYGGVQGEVISDICAEDEKGMKYWESDLNEVSELLTQYVFGRSIYNIAFSQTAYPIMWMQATVCPTCNGKKVVGLPQDGSIPRAQTGDMLCPECGGTGKYPHVQNSDTYIWEYNKDVAGNVPTPPLGIIETAIGSLQYMKDEKADIETMVNITLWGLAKVFPNTKSPDVNTRPAPNTSETAFEANLNEQPKYDKLKEYSKWLGGSIKWYADTMGKLKYGDSYISSAILPGDRYAIESPDEILTRITKAKAAGAAQAILESLHMEYLETKYENNPLELRKQTIYYKGEPYFFFTVTDILAWPQIPQIQLLEKQMWGEFMCTLDDQIIASIPDDAIIPTIQKMVRDYVVGRYMADKATDALLFANDGQLLNIGDNARVKLNQAKDPSDLGKSYKVSNIEGDKVMLEGIPQPYMRAQLERVFV